MKLRICICLLLTLSLGVSGCASKEKNQSQENTDGFHAAGELLMGGAGDATDINVKSLTASTQAGEDEAEETRIDIGFVAGSRISGTGEEQSGCGVPTYTVYVLQNPSRLVVELDNLAFWDYRRDMQLGSPLISDMFQHSFFGNPRIYLYFQLEQPVRVSVQENSDVLSILLRPLPREEAQLYFVSAYAYDEYREGRISQEFNVSPTFSADHNSILLISPAMATEEAAHAYLKDAQQQYPALVDLWQIVTLAGGELPEYDRTQDYIDAYRTPAVRMDNGRELTLSVIAPDGLYLCDLPNEAGFLYSAEMPAGDDGESFQQLFAMRGDGQVAQATSFEFSAIERAMFSPDGRKLAVLEKTKDGSRLYVFDADTYELLNDLSEMGFGTNTSGFIWNNLGNMIYAITGVSDVQLHQFDFSIPDETQRHSMVDRNSVDEGSLGYCDGELYFVHASLEEGSTIYRIKPEGGVRKPFLPGERFAVSGDEKFMAIAQNIEAGSTGTDAALQLYEFATGKKTAITSDFYPYDFLWSTDCSRLYFIESRVSGGQTEEDTTDDVDAQDDASVSEAEPEPSPEASSSSANQPEAVEDPYPYTLWVYDVATGQVQRLFDLCAPDFYAGINNHVLLLNRYETNLTGTFIRAAYQMDVDELLNAPTPVEEAPSEELTIR